MKHYVYFKLSVYGADNCLVILHCDAFINGCAFTFQPFTLIHLFMSLINQAISCFVSHLLNLPLNLSLFFFIKRICFTIYTNINM